MSIAYENRRVHIWDYIRGIAAILIAGIHYWDASKSIMPANREIIYRYLFGGDLAP